jgi:hypothetical protein
VLSICVTIEQTVALTAVKVLTNVLLGGNIDLVVDDGTNPGAEYQEY